MVVTQAAKAIPKKNVQTIEIDAVFNDIKIGRKSI